MTERRTLVVAALAAGAALIYFFYPTSSTKSGLESPAEQELTARVYAACSSCHLFPPPDSLPRPVWRTQIEHMKYLVGYLSGMPNVPSVEFDVEEVVAWYEERSPEHFRAQNLFTRNRPNPLQFGKQVIALGPGGGSGIAAVHQIQVGRRGRRNQILVLPNMMNGSIHMFSAERGPVHLGTVGHPVHVAAGDIDGDGSRDLVVSDLGDTMPTDEPVGRVLVGISHGGASFEFEPVLEGIGRVSDARPVDLDGDGDLDIIVASFGWHRRGGIYVLYNESAQGGPLDFRVEQVVARSGAVSIIPVEDLHPGMGRGFVVAFAQHHEQVSAFYPAEEGYEEFVLYRAPHPVFGMSNLEPVDLDGDGDLDFLLAHGQTLDDGVPFKANDGVEWLENTGDGKFRSHRIGGLYGAHRAEAGDFDRDGDLDVVASGFLPQVQLPVESDGKRVDSLIWFEQTEQGGKREWVSWAIEVDHPLHTGMTLLDLNRDGRLDVVAGINRAWGKSKRERGPSLEVWFNQGRR